MRRFEDRFQEAVHFDTSTEEPVFITVKVVDRLESRICPSCRCRRFAQGRARSRR